MSELGSCDRGISGEHLVSKSIMRLLAGDGEFTVGGLPWIPDGEFRAVGFKSLTANCLCGLHNSHIHPLDDAALAFFTALRSCLEREADDLKFIVSGHDIERWLLKTLKAMAVSSNLMRGGQTLSGTFQNDLSVVNMLDDITGWPPGAGLYCTMNTGDITHNHNRFRLAPLTNDTGELGGLWTEIMGLSFVLLLEPLDLSKNPQLKDAVYRPGEIVIDYPGSRNWLVISWEDGKPHGNAMSLKFVGPASTPWSPPTTNTSI